MALVVSLKTAINNRITTAVHKHSFISLTLGQEMGKIMIPWDDFYKSKSSTYADWGKYCGTK